MTVQFRGLFLRLTMYYSHLEKEKFNQSFNLILIQSLL